MLEVGPVDSELVERVQLRFHDEGRSPGVAAVAFQYVHSVVHSRAAILAEHLDLWRGLIVVRIRGEDDVPAIVDVVEFGGPEIRRVVGSFWRLEDKTAFGSIPVTI